MSSNTTTELQKWLDLLQEGQDQGRVKLIDHACERLRKLTRRMLRGYLLVRKFEQTDDVLQNSMLRLFKALADMTPENLRHFFNLAAQQIRRELLDLAKHHARHEKTGTEAEGTSPDDEPSTLAQWTEFHETVETLPDDEREVFSLLWYEELTQAEAAEVLGISTRTVIRRWQAARIKLEKALYGE
jgi:RNA polymerase sigma-70 factor (ECF subfamily)